MRVIWMNWLFTEYVNKSLITFSSNLNKTLLSHNFFAAKVYVMPGTVYYSPGAGFLLFKENIAKDSNKRIPTFTQNNSAI